MGKFLGNLKKNALHRALGVKAGKPIPHDKLMKALHSRNAHMRKMAQFAVNEKKFNH